MVVLAPGARVTEELVHDIDSPDDLETVELRLIVPENPLMLVKVIARLLDDPWTIDSELVLTVMLNVPTDTLMISV